MDTVGWDTDGWHAGPMLYVTTLIGSSASPHSEQE